ncbi:hypothetical protein BDD12DRAFT_909620 [Trichophaea hybrida]|nr:hypothetical protein BDD12DRAFT_909620 [Trichophaea hybrida]
MKPVREDEAAELEDELDCRDDALLSLRLDDRSLLMQRTKMLTGPTAIIKDYAPKRIPPRIGSRGPWAFHIPRTPALSAAIRLYDAFLIDRTLKMFKILAINPITPNLDIVSLAAREFMFSETSAYTLALRLHLALDLGPIADSKASGENMDLSAAVSIILASLAPVLKPALTSLPVTSSRRMRRQAAIDVITSYLPGVCGHFNSSGYLQQLEKSIHYVCNVKPGFHISMQEFEFPSMKEKEWETLIWGDASWAKKLLVKSKCDGVLPFASSSEWYRRLEEQLYSGDTGRYRYATNTAGPGETYPAASTSTDLPPPYTSTSSIVFGN